MTPTSPARTRDPAWVTLGQAVVNRRVELGIRTREAFAAKAEISTKILGEIERGDRTSYDPATLAALEQALEWPAGMVRRLVSQDARVRLIQGDPEAQALGSPVSTLLYLCGPQSPLPEQDRQGLLQLVAVLVRPYEEWVARRGNADG